MSMQMSNYLKLAYIFKAHDFSPIQNKFHSIITKIDWDIASQPIVVISRITGEVAMETGNDALLIVFSPMKAGDSS